MATSRFHIVITGDTASRAALVGGILLADIYKETTVSHGVNTEHVQFRYRGDARLVLRRAAVMLTHRKPAKCDVFQLGGATARVVKVSA